MDVELMMSVTLEAQSGVMQLVVDLPEGRVDVGFLEHQLGRRVIGYQLVERREAA